MPQVEVFEDDRDTPLFTGKFDFLPRLGETGKFRACIDVKLDD